MGITATGVRARSIYVSYARDTEKGVSTFETGVGALYTRFIGWVFIVSILTYTVMGIAFSIRSCYAFSAFTFLCTFFTWILARSASYLGPYIVVAFLALTVKVFVSCYMGALNTLFGSSLASGT